MSGQPFFPPITGPGRGQAPGPRDNITTSEQGVPDPNRPDILTPNGNEEPYIDPTPPPKIFDTRQIPVPIGAANFMFQIPDYYDWVAFFFSTAPAATLTLGIGGGAYLPILTAGLLVLPGTARQYYFSNSSAALYTVYFMGGVGYPRPEFFKI